MEFSATFGLAAQVASKSGDTAGAAFFADQSRKLSQAAIGIICGISPDVTKAYGAAGIACPK